MNPATVKLTKKNIGEIGQSDQMDEVRLISDEDEVRASYSVMKQLRTHLSETEYVQLVAHQRKFDAYQLLGLFQSGMVQAVAGFRLLTSLANGKHVYVDDLISDELHRSKGYGKILLDWIASHGKGQGCGSLHLDSGVQRHGAHRFYLRERMDIVYYHFRRPLQLVETHCNGRRAQPVLGHW